MKRFGRFLPENEAKTTPQDIIRAAILNTIIIGCTPMFWAEDTIDAAFPQPRKTRKRGRT